MMIARRSGFGVCLGVLLMLICAVSVSAAPAAEQAPGKADTPPVTGGQEPLCSTLPPPSCLTNGTPCNTPFELTKCWTTSYGPARADMVVVPAGTVPAVPTKSPNMLACKGGGPYALCFFSGPPGIISGGKQALPCTLDREGLTANCTCQYYSSGTYFVDINGILNQGAYFEAVNQCGADGTGCLNITNCQQDSQGVYTCSGPQQAKVCNYINSQSSGNSATSFYPTAQAQIISTFSFAMTPPYSLSAKAPTCPKAKYAGCMTAPCRFADGSDPSTHQNGDAIQCACPVYEGEYQVGAAGQACTIDPANGNTYVWSASNTVVQTSDSKK